MGHRYALVTGSWLVKIPKHVLLEKDELLDAIYEELNKILNENRLEILSGSHVTMSHAVQMKKLTNKKRRISD
jgi:hypothetical protein